MKKPCGTHGEQTGAPAVAGGHGDLPASASHSTCSVVAENRGVSPAPVINVTVCLRVALGVSFLCAKKENDE